MGLAGEDERPLGVSFDRGHEGIGDEDGEVEIAQPAGLQLGGDEILDVRVIAAHGRHHRAAARAGGHDGAAHRVPDIHEGERAGRVGGDAADGGAFRPQRGEIVADAAALLHRERRFAQMREDAAEIVRDGAHHEAVEQRDASLGAGAGENPAGGLEAEILQRLVEGALPAGRLGLRLRQRAGDPAPAILDRAIERSAVAGLEAVFRVPNLARDGGERVSHAGGRCHVYIHGSPRCICAAVL